MLEPPSTFIRRVPLVEYKQVAVGRPFVEIEEVAVQVLDVVALLPRREAAPRGERRGQEDSTCCCPTFGPVIFTVSAALV